MAITEEQIAAAAAIQEQAASDDHRRVRVVAGPGTGKSFTIEGRVCWLLDQGIDPGAIAAVSFTRASSLDLQSRVRAACARAGHPEAQISVTTLHSLALRSLRAAGALAAYPADPLVLDRWELREIFDAEFGRVCGISSIKRRQQIREDHEAFWSTGTHGTRPSQRPPAPPISETERSNFRNFHGPRTQIYSCVLPGELVQRCVQMMEAGTLDPVELLEIDHLIVDEFQDLNPMDLQFVHWLGARISLFVAGDDDQSLYSFRYASPEGIQAFPSQYDQVGDHVLSDCFRCTPEVLTSAESLIEAFSAQGRISKSYVSLYEEADPPLEGSMKGWRFQDSQDEATAIARSCKRLIDAGVPPREIMVLLSNAQALTWQLRDAFQGHDVEFEPPRAKPFKDSAEGRALLTILRLAGQDEDYVALRTCLTLPKGIGITTGIAVAEATLNEDLNYRDLFYGELAEGLFTGRTLSALELARERCDELLAWEPEDTLEEREDDIDEILEHLLGEEPDLVWRDELEAVPAEATLAEVRRFFGSERDDERASVLAEIHTRLGQEVDVDEVFAERVRFMTMHGAKGLSASIVFIPGLEEEILPGRARVRFPAQVLEAGRMLYVSMTRARLACIASYSRRRFMEGAAQTHAASRFTAHLGVQFQPGGNGISADEAEAWAEELEDL